MIFKHLNKNTREIWFIATLLLIAVLTMVPWYPDFIQTISADEAYSYVYHEIYVRRLDCGYDMFCLFGTWGFWYWPIYHPDSYNMLILSHIYVSIIIVYSLIHISSWNIDSYLARSIIIVGIMMLLAIDLDARIFLVNILFLILFKSYLNTGKIFPMVLTLTVISFSFFVKPTFVLIGMITVIMATFIELTRTHKIPLVAFSYLLLIGLFTYLSGMGIMSIPDYLLKSIIFSVSYAEVFSQYGPKEDLLVFIVLSLIFAWIVVKIEWRQGRIQKYLFIAGYALIVMIIYKSSFTRHDGQHVMHGYIALVTGVISYVIASIGVYPGKKYLKDYIKKNKKLLVVFIIVFGVTGSMFLSRHPSIYQGKIEKLNTNVEAAIDVISGGDMLLSLHQKAKNIIINDFPVDTVPGSVLLWDDLQTIGFAHELDLVLIPTVALSGVVHHRFEKINSDFLKSDKSPDYILASKNSIYPGRSVISIVENYKFDKSNQSFLQLKKRQNKNEINIKNIRKIDGKFNQKINVIDLSDKILWVDIKISKTIVGEVIGLAYKLPHFFIEIERVDGSIDRVPMIASLNKDGFVLSWSGISLYDILNRGNLLENSPVRNFTLRTESDLSLYYDPNFIVNISNISY
jgi:hypothetical protein